MPWIKTQNSLRIINVNQIVDIFISKTAPVLYAETVMDADHIILGEFEDRDTCKRVLDWIFTCLGNGESMTIPKEGV